MHSREIEDRYGFYYFDFYVSIMLNIQLAIMRIKPKLDVVGKFLRYFSIFTFSCFFLPKECAAIRH
jgi:hypothetical protein